MKTTELLVYLRELDVRLWLDGDSLRYSAPDGVFVPALRAQVAEHKAEIITLLRNAQASSHSLPEPSLAPVSRENAPFPLSFEQQGLWMFDQLEPGNPSYNLLAAFRLQGFLSVAALEQSLWEIVRRHEVLRTTFILVDGAPAQVIAATPSLSLPIIDLQGLPISIRESNVEQLATQEALQPFNLAQGPLLRIRLLRFDQATHILLLIMHHIVSDGWSMGIFAQELSALYSAFRIGRPSPLADLPIQYVDYAVWQRQRLREIVLEEQLAYWKRQLAGIPSLLKLPTDHPRPTQQSFRGASQSFVISHSLSEELGVLSQRAGLTLFMTLLAAFQVLLQRYSGQEDIVVGSPVANRSRREVERLIGFFVNTVVFRTNLSGDPSFEEVLERVRKVCMEAYTHQDLPFEKLVEDLQPERNLSFNPLFQVMFTMQNTHEEELYLPDLKVSSLEIEQKTSMFDLSLFLEVTESGIDGVLEYATDLFNADTITRMIGHFQMLLANAVKDPKQRISALSFLMPAEEHQILIAWNATQASYEQDRCLHEFVEQQVARTPDAVAIVCQEACLTYEELNRRANQLAYHLQALGVGPEVLVGICMERSLELLVGLLAIVKAGGAYVPLDPSYPAERLAFMIEDSQVTVLLTQEHLRAHLASSSATVLCVDTEWRQIATWPSLDLSSKVSPANVAYMIYTSGSTGKPKGVMIHHASVANFFAAMDDQLGCEDPGTWLAVTSTSFDISVLELFWTLARGFKVVLQAEERLQLSFSPEMPPGKELNRKMEFSLFYFADANSEFGTNRYNLLLEGAKFADQHGFAAVWTPERHFHPFGGLYPNPSVTSAAIAAVTKRIQIRAGSVVLPLHNPLRVAEEWSVVDNISDGRVGISFASGWHVDDFAFAPENYTRRKEVMFANIETIRKLWRGEAISCRNGAGDEINVKIQPKPVQSQLPIWVTAAGSPETFKMAGEIGANVLTHLLGQSIEELAEKIALYRRIWREHGHGPGNGHVTLMLHTFVGRDSNFVREKVRKPFSDYLRSSLDLMRNLARDIGLHISSPELTEVDIETLVAYGFDRYFETSGLFGTPETCIEIVNRLKAIQVDEIGCLIDFGVDFDSVFSSLQYLYKLKQQCERQTEMVLQDDSLDAQILKYNVSHVQCTPSLARVLATSSKSSNALQILKKLLLGGEALPPALVETLRQEMPGELHNMYGPTETTIWSTTSALGNSGDKVSIGRPIRNTQVYILDSHYQPVPIGVPGELFIAGSGVARGYLHSPELTAEKFVPAPFSRTPGERMYRTGDLARYLPDGTIDFLGRIDHQVKLRGFRIELREIESTLELHPTVREAIVLVREDIPGDKRLVAYLTLNNAHGFSITTLSDFIHAKLPGYMIPSAFVILDALPLTPNGKVDRGKLPQPDKTNLLLETAHMPPRTFEENILVELWTDLLGVERIGIFDNFFKVGGDSLSAMQLISRIRATFKVGLSLRTFFEAPTIAGLADQIKVLGQRPEISGLVPALSLPDRNYSPLSYPQQRYWIVDRLEPGNPGSNVTFAVQLKGDLNVSALEQSLKEIIKRHEALRTTFVQAEDRIVQFISKEPALDLLMIDLSQFMEAEREAQARSLCTEESLYHFSLEAGPLIRASLLRLTSQEHVLVLNMHHIITDGWSNDIFIWEMKVLYGAISVGELPLLPALPIQYRDFALWQNRQNDILEARLSYWVKQLEDAPAGIEWPHRSANQVNLVNRAAKQRLTFSTTFTEQLKALSQQENVTLFITLLSVFSVLLYNYSNQEDIVIGAPVANRTWSEVEGLIGLFVNTLVLRINVTGDPSFQELLRRVRKVSLDAYSHADVPFEQVLKALHPEISLKRHPLYQILFVSENVPARNLEPSGLSVCDFSFDSGATIYDMVFSIQEVKQGLICSIEYNTSLFDATTIAQLCRRFSSLMEAIVANPKQHLSDLFCLLLSDAAPDRDGETSSNDALMNNLK